MPISSELMSYSKYEIWASEGQKMWAKNKSSEEY